MLSKLASTIPLFAMATTITAAPVKGDDDWHFASVNTFPGTSGTTTTGRDCDLSVRESLCHELCHVYQEKERPQCYDGCYRHIQAECDYQKMGLGSGENPAGPSTPKRGPNTPQLGPSSSSGSG
ncbi:uncharacterized protein APUU_22057A [Aspergillus puulaauensis]|uniref:Uncharacterized protein n=1 Tax=Aspergillus puulaauensis TaxID=1220207 RepID=A0A7R8ALG1_9EURO|nr:uncharacterized protein APUU_22057A [Aspergillus puulaauensis]BCS21625.1 hypothetical protein APUU_22057A [Aspergillus puulaauensis]